MTSSDRCVFDTNVVVSALLFPDSKPGRGFFPTLHDEAMLISDALMTELRAVLLRPKFDRYVSTEDRAMLLELMIDQGALVPITISLQVCRDPKDNHVLELAVSGSATCIVTGDHDLLALDAFQGILIRTPDAFLAGEEDRR
jgi:putative PIN family toxin of toxin-antitoxin system